MTGAVVDVSKALPSTEAQCHERHVARITTEATTAMTRAAIILPMASKTMNRHISPCEDELQHPMRGAQRVLGGDHHKSCRRLRQRASKRWRVEVGGGAGGQRVLQFSVRGLAFLVRLTGIDIQPAIDREVVPARPSGECCKVMGAERH